MYKHDTLNTQESLILSFTRSFKILRSAAEKDEEPKVSAHFPEFQQYLIQLFQIIFKY